MRKIIILLISFIGLAIAVHAQQDPQFTMFMFNRQNLNPGYTGSEEASIFQFVGRKQWVDVKGAPSTFAASFSSPLGNKSTLPKSAIGVSFYSDNIGVSNRNYVAFQYAYRVLLGKETVLSTGVQGSVMNLSRDLAALNPHESGDPTLEVSGPTSDNIGNVGTGLYLYHPKYYFGIGTPNVLVRNLYDSEEQLIRHFYGMMGYYLQINPGLVLRPALLFKYAIDKTRRAPMNVDANLSGIWHNKFMLGVSYRWKESIDAIMKLRISENLFVGYAYDFRLMGISTYSQGSHEITLGFNWGMRTKGVNSPRFINYF